MKTFYSVTDEDISSLLNNFSESCDMPLDYNDQPVDLSLLRKAIEMTVTHYLEAMFMNYPGDTVSNLYREIDENVTFLLRQERKVTL